VVYAKGTAAAKINAQRRLDILHKLQPINLDKTRRKFSVRFVFFAKYAPKTADYAKNAPRGSDSATIKTTQRQTPIQCVQEGEKSK
jgi:hypothetical protein